MSEDQLSSISKMIGFRIFYTQLVLMTPKVVNLTEDPFLKLNGCHIKFNILHCFHFISWWSLVKHKQNTSQRGITMLLEKKTNIYSEHPFYYGIIYGLPQHCIILVSGIALQFLTSKLNVSCALLFIPTQLSSTWVACISENKGNKEWDKMMPRRFLINTEMVIR